LPAIVNGFETQTRSSNRFQKPRILVVEDNEHTRDIFRTTLEHAGYDVLEASDGEQALARVREGPPDLVLMDFAMPRLDGLSCLKILKAEATTRSIPIIAVTAHGEMEFRIEASLAGCDGFLAKPVEPMEIVRAVEALTGPAEADSQAQNQ
jgi:CheY-like chemotaxis protein